MAAARKGPEPGGGAVNVQVILRCRPCNKDEVASRVPQVIACNEAAREVTLYQSVGSKQLGRSFHFDKVFAPESGQEKLYTQAIAPIVEEVLEGFNCTIFAYGQTGTGKTYTMEGGARNSEDGFDLSEAAGVIPRAIHQIFTTLDAHGAEYTVKCSFLELYQEESSDLLAVGDAANAKLRMLEDRGGVVVQGLEEIIVRGARDIYALLDRGSAKRRTAETLLNKQSSRSHSVFCVTVHMREMTPDGEEVIKIGKLYLVDLAGSENVSRSGAVDQRAKEAGLINKSLLTLGRVITALVEGSGHVPYRDSKLTRLLRDSLGGRTKTCVIATIAPTVQCQEETLSTLDYAHRAKNIRNRPEVNQRISKTAHIKELNTEIGRLKAELHATREKNGVYIPLEHFHQQEQSQAATLARVEQLEAEAEAAREVHRAEVASLTTELSSTQEELASTFGALGAARRALEERDFLIAAHGRSEAALAEHADALAAGLAAAAADMQLLFERLGAAASREGANEGAVAELRAAAAQRLAALESGVGAAVDASAARYGAVRADLTAHAGRAEADLAALQGQLAALERQLAAAAAAGVAATAATAGAGTDAASTAAAAYEAYAAAAQQAAAQAAEALVSAHKALAGTLARHRAGLDAAAAAAVGAEATLLQGARRTLRVSGDALAATGAAAGEARAAAGDAAAAQGAALQRFGTAFEAGMQQEQARLVEAVGALLSEFAQRARREVADAVGGLAAQLAAGTETVGQRFDALDAAAASADGALHAEAAAAEAAAAAAAQARAAHEAAAAATLAQATEQGDALLECADAAQANARSRLAEHSAAAAAAGSSAAAAIAAAAAEGGRQLEAAAAAAQATRAALAADLGGAHAREAAALEAVAGAAAAGAKDVRGFGREHGGALAALGGQVADFAGVRFQRDPLSGALPQLRPPALPAPGFAGSLRTPAPDAVLCEFRRQHDTGAAASAGEGAAGGASPTEDGAEAEAPAAVAMEGMQERAGAWTDAGGENADPNRPTLTLAAAPGEAKPSRIPMLPAGKPRGDAGAGSRLGSRAASPVRQR
ncbi:hypothetical protein WJX81_005423 [Elliptochloris bilobata]|uniref:Kinesin motor domain-containing protein n=1 Tax=Elliptochloris bilobata TaxID=381761 RepID=A0AAW1QN28_9CHLO